MKSQPPTLDAFAEHVYLSDCDMETTLSSERSPGANPVQYGWIKTKDGNLFPVMLPSGISPVLAEMLQIIKCGCI